MIIHQQLLPPKQLLPHIKNTSKEIVSGFAAHSMVFRLTKKVRQKLL